MFSVFYRFANIWMLVDVSNGSMPGFMSSYDLFFLYLVTVNEWSVPVRLINVNFSGRNIVGVTVEAVIARVGLLSIYSARTFYGLVR